MITKRGRFEIEVSKDGRFTLSYDGNSVGTIDAREIADLQQVTYDAQVEVGRILRRRMEQEGPYWP